MLLGTKDQKLFNKEYLPGYTGFVPTKNDHFGMTAGDVNRNIVVNGGHTGFNFPTGSTHGIRFYRQNMTPVNKPNKNVFGNWSKHAQNWIAGPTHEICMQHIPGYTGHVPGVISENLFSKSYAKCTSSAIGKRNPRGHDVPSHVRYLSLNKQEYNPKNFRRFVENPELKPCKDYDDYTKYVNGEFSKQKEMIVSQSIGFGNSSGLDKIRTKTASGGFVKTFRSTTATPTMRLSVADGKDLTSGTVTLINDIKPRLLETRVAENQEFFKLSDGFKKIFANDKKDQKIVIPISGYAGHRRGDRSQNYFGKSFRDISIQSRRLQRALHRGGSVSVAARRE